jgi:hypothetical protein
MVLLRLWAQKIRNPRPDLERLLLFAVPLMDIGLPSKHVELVLLTFGHRLRACCIHVVASMILNVLRTSTKTNKNLQRDLKIKSVTDRGFRITSPYTRNQKYTAKRIRRDEMAKNIKKIVNIRLRPDQEERINAIVERSAILDTSKFVCIESIGYCDRTSAK